MDTKKCRHCKGDGVYGDPPRDCEECAGTGWIVPAAHRIMDTEKQHPDLDEMGNLSIALPPDAWRDLWTMARPRNAGDLATLAAIEAALIRVDRPASAR
jgi:hypothetical protein